MLRIDMEEDFHKNHNTIITFAFKYGFVFHMLSMKIFPKRLPIANDWVLERMAWNGLRSRRIGAADIS
jgi:hypothetical protein